MEHNVLEACLASGAIALFSIRVNHTSLSPSILSPSLTGQIPPHLFPILSDHFSYNHQSMISITELRWGVLMNELAADEGLFDGASAENGLGKWLYEPPSSCWVIDFNQKKCLLPNHIGTNLEKNRKEDVAIFIVLACKLREPWQWKLGRMVGDNLKGVWEEMVDSVKEISGKFPFLLLPNHI
ncbi:hypothetical protein O181_038197 [Austropuccinia psidii MF-1]|uniref:Uncharacterized protein n=1 Tax=Austropuccinia psidii MF-1 TaxID=1389203 RepID=A0A9Q3DEA5_9BASI|nr:hypothetical protein [Austropuccinia psidii MF-1]